ncbi:MAG: hypothetical protein UX89_C0005G0051 [Parcubacteria group bacterium GW2011_GWA2_47_16]|nr:MAG: hypothetical protein UX89_C0005G0051 [Parcubacteria group bacterium GW2011_GWA2_47_16]
MQGIINFTLIVIPVVNPAVETTHYRTAFRNTPRKQASLRAKSCSKFFLYCGIYYGVIHRYWPCTQLY